MKSAVNTEKAILRQRLNRIKTLASKIIKENYSDANKLYSSLEDLYLYTFKVEQKAIFGLSKIFKKSIENEEKIEFQIQIKHVEVVQTQSIRNFEKPKVVVFLYSLLFNLLEKTYPRINLPSQTLWRYLNSSEEKHKVPE